MTVNTGLINYGGNGTPILLIHGFMGRGRTWNQHISWLKQLGQVFTFDAAYHQGIPITPPPTLNELSPNRFIADIAETLTWIDKGPAILIGHSMGALHAWQTAHTYPELVAALIIEDMCPDLTNINLLTWYDKLVAFLQTNPNSVQLINKLGSTIANYYITAFDSEINSSTNEKILIPHGDYQIWRKILSSIATEKYWTFWTNIRCPSLLLGSAGSFIDQNQMQKMADYYSNSTYNLIKNANHIIHDSAAKIFQTKVTDFIKKLSL